MFNIDIPLFPSARRRLEEPCKLPSIRLPPDRGEREERDGEGGREEREERDEEGGRIVGRRRRGTGEKKVGSGEWKEREDRGGEGGDSEGRGERVRRGRKGN